MKNIMAILRIICAGFIGFIVGIVYQHKEEWQKICQLQNKVNKFQSYYNILIDWLSMRLSGESLGDKILKMGYKTIAIYGMGELGKCLYIDIGFDNIEVKYAIDSSGINSYKTIPVVDNDSVKDNVDAIIVTAIYDFDVIKEKLESMVTCPIISLSEIIWKEN